MRNSIAAHILCGCLKIVSVRHVRQICGSEIEMMNWSDVGGAAKIALVAILGLSACVPVSSTDFPVSAEAQANAPMDNVSIIRLTPQNIGAYRAPEQMSRGGARLPSSPGNWQYQVGVGDVLSITVWDHPELTLPAGPQRSQLESGSWVNADGRIFYPYIGQLAVAGESIVNIQQDLTEMLAEFIPDPQVEVKVAAFNSQKVVITGAITQPGSLPVTNLPLSLIEAVNAVGGLRDGADARQVTVRRGGQNYYVDLQAFLENGRSVNNPLLRGGDIVNVPNMENNVAYVLGQISSPGPVDLGARGINLTDAISRQGGLVEGRANAKGIFVFRDQGSGIAVFQLDAATPLAFVLATEFTLHPQDVVYIVSDPAAKWNSIIERLLPSISAIRAVQVIGGGL